MAFSKGDVVKITCSKYATGQNIPNWVKEKTHVVYSDDGSRVLLGHPDGINSYVPVSGVTLVQSANPPAPQPTPTPPAPDPPKKDEPVMDSQGLDDALTKLMNSSVNDGAALKASMRLFGMPFQYTSFTDCRIDNVSKELGRKFIENIVLEAPIITMIPGKPVYLPAAKDKQGTSQALMAAANGSFSELASLGSSMSTEQLRYFDFEQDYIEYMKYVNILCRVAAGFLEIGDVELNGTPLVKYNWMNYRFASDSYVSTASNMFSSTKEAATGAVNMIKNYGAEALKTATLGAIDLTEGKKSGGDNKVLFDEAGDNNEGLLSTLDSLLAHMNYVQFYVDPASSSSESASNSTATSKLEGLLDQGSDLLKELAFVVNSGGGDAKAFQDFTSESLSALTTTITNGSSGGISGFLSRILNTGSNIIKGENLVIPEIYQRSDYSKSYSITINLKCPYGDKYSYYMNVLVPMLHCLAFAIPKQSTPNTYSSPFLIKAYLPGVFNCNLGIVDSISIERNPSGDAWTTDGLPAEMRVSMQIKDLYSELTMAPSNDPLLFMSNSSLIDYLSVSCGLDLTKPQIQNKVGYLMSIVMSSFTDIPENIKGEWIKAVDKLVQGWIKIN